MPITEYSQPAHSDFINTYSPIPFQELMSAGAQKRQDYEQGLQNLTQTYQDAYNLKYIPNSKDEEYIKGHVIPSIKSIVDKYSTMDLSDPIVRRQMRNDLNTNIDPSRIRDIQSSYTGWQQNQQTRQKLMQEGKYKPVFDYQDKGYDTSSQGIYSRMTPAALDYRKKASDYFDKLKGDSYITPSGEVVETLDPRKIDYTASGNIQDFIQSVEGQQMVAEYYATHSDSKLSPSEVSHQYLLDVGRERLYSQHRAFVPKHLMGDKEGTVPGYLPDPGRISMIDIKNQKFSPSDFDIKTRIIPKAPSYEGSIGAPVHSKPLPREFYYDTNLLNKPEIQSIISNLPHEYRIYKDIIDKGPKGQDPNVYKGAQDILFDKLKHIYQDVQENMKDGSYVLRYNEALRKKQTIDLFNTQDASKLGAGDLPNRKFYVIGDDIGDKGYYNNGTDFYNNFVKKLLNKTKNTEISAIGDLTPENPISHPSVTNDPDFINGTVATIGGKTVIVSSPSTSYKDIGAHKTYWNLRALPNTELEENINGVRVGEKYIKDPNTGQEDYLFTIGDPTTGKQQVLHSPIFSEVYNAVYDILNPNRK